MYNKYNNNNYNNNNNYKYNNSSNKIDKYPHNIYLMKHYRYNLKYGMMKNV